MSTTDSPKATSGDPDLGAASRMTRPAEADAALVDALARGDEAVYTDLIDRFYPAMLRLALAHVGDRDLADDVVQETWIAVVEGIGRFEGRAALRTWIFRILLNVARKRATQERRFLPFGDAGGSGVALDGGVRRDGCSIPSWLPHVERWGPQQNPEDWVVAREVIERIEAAIEALPPNQRAVVTLRDVEGWTSKEVCDLLEISRANQRVLLHRARHTMREVLRPYLHAMGDGAPGPDPR